MEVLTIIGILILLFGAKQIPKLAKSIGQTSLEFSRAMGGTENDIQSDNADKSVVRR